MRFSLCLTRFFFISTYGLFVQLFPSYCPSNPFFGRLVQVLLVTHQRSCNPKNGRIFERKPRPLRLWKGNLKGMTTPTRVPFLVRRCCFDFLLFTFFFQRDLFLKITTDLLFFPAQKSLKFVSTWNVATCHWTMSFGSVLMAALANSLRIPGSSGLRLVQLPIWYATPFNPGMMVSYLSLFPVLLLLFGTGKRILLSTIWRARRDAAASSVVSAGVVYAHKSGEKSLKIKAKTPPTTLSSTSRV